MVRCDGAEDDFFEDDRHAVEDEHAAEGRAVRGIATQTAVITAPMSVAGRKRAEPPGFSSRFAGAQARMSARPEQKEALGQDDGPVGVELGEIEVHDCHRSHRLKSRLGDLQRSPSIQTSLITLQSLSRDSRLSP